MSLKFEKTNEKKKKKATKNDEKQKRPKFNPYFTYEMRLKPPKRNCVPFEVVNFLTFHPIFLVLPFCTFLFSWILQLLMQFFELLPCHYDFLSERNERKVDDIEK